MKDPKNMRGVGYSMILVSASLVAILVMGLAIGEDVLFADNMSRDSTAHFNECKANDFKQTDVRYTGIESILKFQEYT